MAFLYKIHRRVITSGVALLALCFYAGHKLGWRALLVGWPLPAFAVGLLSLGLALWRRERGEDEAIEKDIREARLRTESLIAHAKDKTRE